MYNLCLNSALATDMDDLLLILYTSGMFSHSHLTASLCLGVLQNLLLNYPQLCESCDGAMCSLKKGSCCFLVLVWVCILWGLREGYSNESWLCLFYFTSCFIPEPHCNLVKKVL